MQYNDYIVFEDTIPYYNEWIPKTTTKDGLYSMNNLNKYFIQHKETKAKKWMVDTKYCDYYGYNSTYNWNSFLKRMS